MFSETLKLRLGELEARVNTRVYNAMYFQGHLSVNIVRADIEVGYAGSGFFFV